LYRQATDALQANRPPVKGNFLEFIMGTRSIIQVVGCIREGVSDREGPYSGSIRLYRHWDGDPSYCLPAIARAVEMIECLVKLSFEWKNDKQRYIGVQSMAAAIVACSMCSDRLTARIEETFTSKLDISDLGDQGDLEWLYIVDCSKRNINVYTTKQGINNQPGTYSGSPCEHLACGVFMKSNEFFAEEYRADCVKERMAQIDKGFQLVTDAGWSMNSQEDPYWRIVAAPTNSVSSAFENTQQKSPRVRPVVVGKRSKTVRAVSDSAFCI
jgi:hypothetical protein